MRSRSPVASSNVCALTIGIEDYTADLGVVKTTEGRESAYARTRIVNAAKAAGLQAIDSVFGDVATWMACVAGAKTRAVWALKAWDAFTRDRFE